jgi:hypothetical protein
MVCSTSYRCFEDSGNNLPIGAAVKYSGMRNNRQATHFAPAPFEKLLPVFYGIASLDWNFFSINLNKYVKL